MIKDIIWDFDGTLFNTYPGLINAFQKALKDFNIDEKKEKILDYFKISESCAVSYYKKMYKLDDDTFMNQFRSYKKEIKPEEVKPFPYAAELCRKNIALGGRNYIITHRGTSTFRFLQYYEMQGYFTEIITRENGFRRKPDVESFAYLIGKYCINKESAIVVGDRDCEVLGGKAAGIRTCFFNSNNISPSIEPDYNIDSLRDFTKLIG